MEPEKLEKEIDELENFSSEADDIMKYYREFEDIYSDTSFTYDLISNPSMIFKEAIRRNASDIIIFPNNPIGFKIDGKYYPISKSISPLDVINIIQKVVSNDLDRNKLGNLYDLDFSLSVVITKKGKVIIQNEEFIDKKEIENGARFRGVIYKQRNGTFSAVFRKVPYIIPTFEELNLPLELLDEITAKMGLIIIAGATGSGKSTTIASMLNYRINTMNGVVYTLEDPIEFVFNSNPSIGSFVTQREIEKDVINYAQGLKSALRTNPSVIFIGELRDPEVINLATVAAETGHLVVTTVHAKSAPEVITRMIQVVSDNSKDMIAYILSQVLNIVIYQTLIPTLDGKLIPALEWFRNSPKITELISQASRKDVVNEIRSIMELTSNLPEKRNMILEFYLLELIKKNKVSKEAALRNAIRPEILNSYIKRM